MEQTKDTEAVLAYIDAINAHDIATMLEMMATDHTLIDARGAVITGRENLREPWTAFLTAFPDYIISVRHIMQQSDIVAVFGTAGGTYTPQGRPEPENSFEIPAAWQVHVREGKISHWQVYADNGPVRDILERVNAALVAVPDAPETGKGA